MRKNLCAILALVMLFTLLPFYSVYGLAVRLEYRGISPCLIAARSSSSRKALAACSI